MMSNTTSTDFSPCPVELTDAQIEQYRRDGYLAFTDILSPEEVAGAKDELARLIEELRHNHTTSSNGYGVLWSSTTGKFKVQFERGQEPASDDDPDAELKARKLHDFVESSDLLHHIAFSHRRVRGVLESLLGADPILFQDMALIKPAFFGSEKPWHQDDAYFAVSPLDAVCGVWIALDDATVENGCMHVLPGWHHKGAFKHHIAASEFHATDCTIIADRLIYEDVVPVPLPAGGGMFFSGLLPHQTPFNTSPDRRRAIQIHYRSATSRIIDFETYNRLFAERDGTPASCRAAHQRGI
ncbi:MAG: phytanoyl-CoA dioxygenase family protein [Armatimonadota bacterium]|nr:phytanoyl-CoA dioxygenase family protein [Armatimonadota bacterium]